MKWCRDIGGQVTYADPNMIFGLGNEGFEEGKYYRSPDLEDYCSIVDLRVVTKPRTYSVAVGNGNTVELVWGGKASGKSVIGILNGKGKLYANSESDISYITDEANGFTEFDLMERRDVCTEMFGIENVSIEYNSFFVPQVTIKFCDIRGLAMFTPEELDRAGRESEGDSVVSAFFSSFFEFPRPKFVLTVKGLYGKPVSYELSLEDFKVDFSENDGSMRVTGRFIGYSYSYLNDMSMNLIMAAPYSEKGSKIWESKFGENGRIRKLHDIYLTVNDLKEHGVTGNTIGLDESVIDQSSDITALDDKISKYSDAKSKLVAVVDAIKAYLFKDNQNGIAVHEVTDDRYILLKDDMDSVKYSDTEKKFSGNGIVYEGDDGFCGYSRLAGIRSLANGVRENIFFNVGDTVFSDANIEKSINAFFSSLDEAGIPEIANGPKKKTLYKDTRYNPSEITLNADSQKFAQSITTICVRNDGNFGKFPIDRATDESELYSEKVERAIDTGSKGIYGAIFCDVSDMLNALNLKIDEANKEKESKRGEYHRELEELWSEYDQNQFGYTISDVVDSVFAHVHVAMDMLSGCCRDALSLASKRKVEGDMENKDGVVPPFPKVTKKEPPRKGENGDRYAETWVGDISSDASLYPEIALIDEFNSGAVNMANDALPSGSVLDEFLSRSNEMLGIVEPYPVVDFAVPYPMAKSDWFSVAGDKILGEVNGDTTAEEIVKRLQMRYINLRYSSVNRDVGAGTHACINLKANSSGQRKTMGILDARNFYPDIKNMSRSEIEKLNKSNVVGKMVESDQAYTSFVKNGGIVSSDGGERRFFPVCGYTSSEDRNLTGKTEEELYRKCMCGEWLVECRERDLMGNGNYASDLTVEECYQDFAAGKVNPKYNTYYDFSNRVYDFVQGKSEGEDAVYEPIDSKDTLFGTVEGDLYSGGIEYAFKTYQSFCEKMDGNSGDVIESLKAMSQDYFDLGNRSGVKGIWDWFVNLFTSDDKDRKLSRFMIPMYAYIGYEYEMDKANSWLAKHSKTISMLKDAYASGFTSGSEMNAGTVRYGGLFETISESHIFIATQSFVKYSRGAEESGYKEYLGGFCDELMRLYNEEFKSQPSVGFKSSEDATEYLNEAKCSLYRYLKIIYDRWMCGDAGVDNELFDYDIRTGKHLYYIDQFYNKCGNEWADFGSLYQTLTDSMNGKDYSVLEFLSEFLRQNQYMFFSIQNFMDLSKEEDFADAFRPIPYISQDCTASVSTDFVCVKCDDPSEVLNTFNENGRPSDGFAVNDAEDLPLSIKDRTEGEYYKIPAFGVMYGTQYQSFFKSISVNMEGTHATEPALKTMFQIANGANNNTGEDVSIGRTTQNLFDVYSKYSYTCKVSMLGSAWVQPMMYFQLLNIPMFSGTYLIQKVTHTINGNNDMTTDFSGVRMCKTSTPRVKADKFLKFGVIDPNGEINTGEYGETFGTMACQVSSYKASDTLYAKNDDEKFEKDAGVTDDTSKYQIEGASATEGGEGYVGDSVYASIMKTVKDDGSIDGKSITATVKTDDIIVLSCRDSNDGSGKWNCYPSKLYGTIVNSYSGNIGGAYWFGIDNDENGDAGIVNIVMSRKGLNGKNGFESARYVSQGQYHKQYYDFVKNKDFSGYEGSFKPKVYDDESKGNDYYVRAMSSAGYYSASKIRTVNKVNFLGTYSCDVLFGDNAEHGVCDYNGAYKCKDKSNPYYELMKSDSCTSEVKSVSDLKNIAKMHKYLEKIRDMWDGHQYDINGTTYIGKRTEISVNSAYRTNAVNGNVKSNHMLGRAMDLQLTGTQRGSNPSTSSVSYQKTKALYDLIDSSGLPIDELLIEGRNGYWVHYAHAYGKTAKNYKNPTYNDKWSTVP